MKKPILAIVLFALVALLILGIIYTTSIRDFSANQMLYKIINAAEVGNAVAIKDLFAPAALEALEGTGESIDEQIDELFQFYSGEMVKIEYFAPREHLYIERGTARIVQLGGHYTVTTEDEIYSIRFTMYSVNHEAPEEVGLHRLVVLRDGEWEQLLEIPFPSVGIITSYDYE